MSLTTSSSSCEDQVHVCLAGPALRTHSGTAGAILPKIRCDRPAICKRNIDMNWEARENVAVRQFKNSTDQEGALCVRSAWYPLAGFQPPGKTKGH